MSSISEILINFMKRGGKFVLFSEDLRKKISHSFSLTDTEYYLQGIQLINEKIWWWSVRRIFLVQNQIKKFFD